MTTQLVAGTTATRASRALSKDLFGREFQLEVAAALATLEAGFDVEELYDEVKRRALQADLETPKLSAVRTSLTRLVGAGAVEILPAPRPGSPAHYTPASASAFWSFAAELYART